MKKFKFLLQNSHHMTEGKLPDVYNYELARIYNCERLTKFERPL